jgi:hypothetical protein
MAATDRNFLSDLQKRRGEREDLCESSTKQLKQNCQISVPEIGESSESLEGWFKGC